MQVSHETIYQSLFVKGRGELRRELSRCLRTVRAKRRPRGSTPGGGRINGMMMISERPAEAEDRAMPGHWEGDLIIGKTGRSDVGTLVERSTRFVLLLHLPNGREADMVNEAIRQAITTLPSELVRSITWDQGRELSHHVNFTVETGVPGSGARTNAPTDCSANTCQREPISQFTAQTTWTDLLAASTIVHARLLDS